MQTTTGQFDTLARGDIRPLSWAFRVSFDKVFDDDVTFFTLDTSVLDGIDILAPSEANIVAEWDKYDYTDYTDRIVQMEWSREETVPYSVSMAIADISLNNFDGYFNRGSGSPIEPYLLPKRPIRILAGFGGLNIPQFVGLTVKSPGVEHSDRLASMHAQDFLSYLFTKPLDQTVIYESVRTDEVLENLFQLFGLTPGQYDLDVGYNLINFVYFEKGTNLGKAVKDLMQAELGNLYMDELGVIRFKNRFRVSDMPVYIFDENNIVDYQFSDEESIINRVEVRSDVREVQATQPVHVLANQVAEPIVLFGGQTTSLFFNFDDPVTSIQDIVNITANSQANGEGTDLSGNISITDTDLFATAIKVTFDNSGDTAYLTGLEIYGTPAKVVRNLFLTFEDTDSITDYDEQTYQLTNNFIQSDDAANSIGLSLLNYYKDYANTIDLEVKGNYALQIGDNIQVYIDQIDQVYTITKITNILGDGGFTQRLKARVYSIPSFFTLDESVLDGSEVLAP